MLLQVQMMLQSPETSNFKMPQREDELGPVRDMYGLLVAATQNQLRGSKTFKADQQPVFPGAHEAVPETPAA